MAKHLSSLQQGIIAKSTSEQMQNICHRYRISRATYYRLKAQETSKHISLQKAHNQLKIAYANLEKHTQKQQEELEILRALVRTLPKSSRLTLAVELFNQYPANAITEALSISKGTLYNRLYRSRAPQTTFQRRHDLLLKLTGKIYLDSERLYGAKKISAILRHQGYNVSHRYIKALMQELNVSGVSNYKPVSHAKPTQILNQLIRKYHIYSINRLWVTDITELKVATKKLYICICLDAFSRFVVGVSFSTTCDTFLTIKALRKALQNRQPANLIIHSDNGAQYVSTVYEAFLKKHHIQHSYSRPATPSDNPIAESFFSILKRELYRRNSYSSIQTLQKAIVRYIRFYNYKRIHSSLGYLSPKEFEAHLALEVPKTRQTELYSTKEKVY